jgi:hypothetical protein
MLDVDILVPAITGLIGVAIGSLAPWVRWWVQQDRERTDYRRQQIKRWREAVQAFDFSTGNFADTVVYTELRAYLDEEFRNGLESGRFTYPAPGRGASATKYNILDAIAERERAWKLI